MINFGNRKSQNDLATCLDGFFVGRNLIDDADKLICYVCESLTYDNVMINKE